jgi:hypothetical protein
MFPDITMGMAKTQDLSLNPSKVSGVCGRLLCCLSYENEQYKQMKAVMPKLGQKTDTPRGAGTVVSLQLLKGLVTVLLDTDNTEETFPARELGFGEVPVSPVRLERKPNEREPVAASRVDVVEVDAVVVEVSVTEGEEISAAPAEGGTAKGGRKRRRRRNRGHGQEHQSGKNEQGGDHTE